MEHNEIRNRRIAKNKRRVDPESIDGLEEQIGALKEAITRSEIIANNLKNNPGWEAIKSDWADRLEQVESELEEFHTLTDKGRDYLLKERQDLKRDLRKVEFHEYQVIQKKAALTDALATLRERKERLGTASV